MTLYGALQGTYRLLGSNELDALRELLLGLSIHDRIARFGNAIPDASIVRYVESLSRRKTIVLGYLHDNCLCGAVELVPLTPEPAFEVAVCIAPKFRRRGIATALMRHAVVVARNRHARCLALDAAGSNFALRALARRAGFALRVQAGSVRGTLSIAPCSPLSVLQEQVREFGFTGRLWVESMQRAATTCTSRTSLPN